MWEDGLDQSLAHFSKSLKNKNISGKNNRSKGVDEEDQEEQEGVDQFLFF